MSPVGITRRANPYSAASRAAAQLGHPRQSLAVWIIRPTLGTGASPVTYLTEGRQTDAERKRIGQSDSFSSTVCFDP